MMIMGAPIGSDDGEDLQSIGSNDDDAPVSQHQEEIAFELRDDLDHAGRERWQLHSRQASVELASNLRVPLLIPLVRSTGILTPAARGALTSVRPSSRGIM